MEQNNPEKAILLSTLEQFGNVEILNENILKFTGKNEETIILRYSVGEVFSFLKGSDPCKIQVKKGHDVNIDNFEKKLKEVIETERDNDYPVTKQYEDALKIETLKKSLQGLPFLEKKDSLLLEYSEYSLQIHPDKKVSFKFKPSFNEIGKYGDVQSLKSVIDTLEEDVKNIKAKING